MSRWVVRHTQCRSCRALGLRMHCNTALAPQPHSREPLSRSAHHPSKGRSWEHAAPTRGVKHVPLAPRLRLDPVKPANILIMTRPSVQSPAASTTPIHTHVGLASTTPPPTTHLVLHPHVNLGQENFWQHMAALQGVIQSSTFVAVDCEMTGLWARGRPPGRLDNYHSRYQQLKESAEKYMVVQLGVSCFTPTSSSSSSTAASAWEVHTWNITMYPDADGASWNPTFSVTAAALEFLANEGFDLSAWVRNGARFMPLSLRLQQVAQLELHLLSTLAAQSHLGDQQDSPASARAANGAGKLQRDARTGELTVADATFGDPRIAGVAAALKVLNDDLGVQPADPTTASWWVTTRRTITDWLRGHSAEPQAEQPVCCHVPASGAAEAHLLEALIRLELWCRPDLPAFTCSLQGPGQPGSAAGRDTWGVQLQLQPVHSGPVAVRGQAARRGEVHRATGPSVLLELLRDAGKPVVLHNGCIDLALLLTHLRGAPLPAAWQDYKALVRRWFPGGLYDTKHLARTLALGRVGPGDPLADLQDLTLQALFSQLSPALTPAGNPDSAEDVIAEEDRYLVAARELLELRPTQTPAVPEAPQALAPEPGEHCDGDDEQEQGVFASGTDSGSEEQGPSSAGAHEAGFDAFTTGAVFVSLSEALRRSQPSEQGDPLHTLNYRVHSGNGAPYYDLSQPADPPPVAANTFLVTGLSPKTQWFEVSNRFKSCGLGPVKVYMFSGYPNIWGAEPQPPVATGATSSAQHQPLVRPQSRPASKGQQQQPATVAGPAGYSDGCLVEVMRPDVASKVVSTMAVKAKGWTVRPVEAWYTGASAR